MSASLVPCIKDYFCYVRKGSFEQVSGKVDSYHSEETGGKNPKTVYNPIVIDEMTGEQLIMKIPNEKDGFFVTEKQEILRNYKVSKEFFIKIY